MPKIDDLTVQRVLDAARIEDVVSEFVTLRRAGVNLTGLCPFHDDRRAGNFIVRPSTIAEKNHGNTYRCFACEAKGGPLQFLMNAERMTFPDAIRWMGRKFNIPVDDVPVNWTPPPPKPTPPPLPDLEIPRKWVKRTMEMATDDIPFIHWLRGLRWSEQQRERIDEVLWRYCVGGWKDGRVVFWLIDHEGVPRAAKLMRYLPDGHRDKTQHPGWIYNQEGCRQHLQPDEHNIIKPLFGGHLLKKYPQAEVHVVESEKTAIVCSIYMGEPEKHLWVATAGKSNLTRELLQPLIDDRRTIAIHPDKDGKEEWTTKMKELSYERAYINDTVLTFQWKPEDGDKADIADVLVRLLEERQHGKTMKMEDIMKTVPAIKTLIDNMDLDIKNEYE